MSECQHGSLVEWRLFYDGARKRSCELETFYIHHRPLVQLESANLGMRGDLGIVFESRDHVLQDEELLRLHS